MLVSDDDDDNTVNVCGDTPTFPDNTTDHNSAITNESLADTNSIPTPADQPVDTPWYPQ